VNDVPQLTPAEIEARVLHRDGLMLVIDKPAGIPVHRGPKGGPNLEASFEALRFGLPRPPSRPALPKRKVQSSCRSAARTPSAAGGRSRTRTVKKP
jgi:23S rRNA-/tRNA-specific pseudouridylate synthase